MTVLLVMMEVVVQVCFEMMDGLWKSKAVEKILSSLYAGAIKIHSLIRYGDMPISSRSLHIDVQRLESICTLAKRGDGLHVELANAGLICSL
jgi:hypothetical protein